MTDFTDIIIKDDETRLIQGYASVEVMDRQGDLVPIDAMKEAMIKYMERGGLLLYGHQNKPIGKVLGWEIEEEPRYGVPAVKIIGQINKGYKLEDEVWKLIKERQITGFSIGGTAIQVDTEKTAEGVDARVLKKIELSEISLVVEPANQGAVITAVSMAKSSDPYESLSDEEFEKKAEEVVKNILYDAFTKGEDIQKKRYPWKQCMRDHHSARLCGWIKAHYGHKGLVSGIDEDFIMHEFIISKDTIKPSADSMRECRRLAAEKLGADNRGDRLGRLCGYMFYYIFNQSRRAFEQFLHSGKPIPDEWIRMHEIHSYYKYMTKKEIIDRESSRGELPDPLWYAKCVSSYEGSESAEKACTYLWYSGYGWGLEKSNEPIPVIDDILKEIAEGFPEFDKLLDEVVEVQKPFAGFKNWADCMRNIGHGKKKYSKEAKQKICGMLKNKFEKGIADIYCPNCGGSNLIVEVTKADRVFEDGEYVNTVAYDMMCKDCNIEFREFVFPDREPMFFLLEKSSEDSDELKKN